MTKPKSKPGVAYSRLHAPHYFFDTGPLCEEAIDVPMAKANGEPINCPHCWRLLEERAQWLNQLLELGYKVQTPATRLRKGRKADPRQVNFREIFM